MPETKDTQGIIRHVAEIIIGELKLEDVTAETFNPDMDLVDELGIDSMDLATIALVLVRIDDIVASLRLAAGFTADRAI